MSLMMPDGKSWTQPYQNPYASQPQQQPFGRVNSTAQPGQPTPGQGGIPQDAIFRTASQPTKAPDMSAYSPGRAQPTQTQGQGTPYGQPAQQQQPANPYANMAPGVYYGGQQIPGNQQQAIQAAMAQRDAMAVLVNNNNMQYSLANAFGQDIGRPQFDYGSAMQQAQNMVQNGFYNPFTQYYNQTTDPLSQLGQNAPPSMYNPQQPFPPIGGFGVQQPPAMRDPGPKAPESYYPGFDPRTQDPYGRAPPAPKRSWQEIGGDFYDPNPGGIKAMVVQDYYNPQTGEEYGGTGIAPREGTGWVAGKSPLATLKAELDQAERDAAYPPRLWDDATRTVVEGPPGAAEKYAQRAENLRRQIAELENSGPAGTARPPSVFRDGDRMTKLPGYRPVTAQPTFLPPSVFPEGHGLGSIGTDLRSHGGDLAGRPVLSPPGYGTDPDGRRMIMDYRDSDRDGVDDRDQPTPGAPPFRPGPGGSYMYGGRDPVLKAPSRLQEWIDAGRPGASEIVSPQMDRSRIDGTPFGSPQDARAYDNWLRSQGGGRNPVLKAPDGYYPGPDEEWGRRARPGTAQPIQPPSRGTPYVQPPQQPAKRQKTYEERVAETARRTRDMQASSAHAEMLRRNYSGAELQRRMDEAIRSGMVKVYGAPNSPAVIRANELRGIKKDPLSHWDRAAGKADPRDTVRKVGGQNVTVDYAGRPRNSPTGGMYVGSSWVSNIGDKVY